MNKKVFSCKAKNCKYEGDTTYMTEIPLEVYERHNMATLFCPYCGCIMAPESDDYEEKKTA